MRRPGDTRQSGAATVEFAVVAVAFFAILFGAIEMSRLLFTWNALGVSKLSIFYRVSARLVAVL